MGQSLAPCRLASLFLSEDSAAETRKAYLWRRSLLCSE
jgi:hypothetical protein